ncbi:MAG: carbohydrate-binding domain-containing protein [Oscillospiraceae bacterium]|nr:carbohydrate-binding domain-containing protein [Oscillospiraceae bacterium]
MKQKKYTLAALLSALMILGGMTACGDSSTPSGSAQKPADSESITEETSAADESTESEAETSAAEKEGKKSGKEESSSKTEKNSKAEKDSKASADSKDSKEESSKESSESKTDAKQESKSENKTESKSDSGTQNPEQKTQTPENIDDPDDEDDEDKVKPTKYIYLQDTTAQYSGEGITVKDGLITIGKGGTYEISGTLSNGQILITTDKKKVKLHLNGASITNKAGSAINCQNAKKLTINSLPGTVNYLEDGGVHDEDKGTVFSEDTVQIKGEGELNIKANYAHGIQSDDDIVINGGTLNIEAAKSCLHSNDGIEINAGVNYCLGGTNGIKTDGFINITGGSSVFIGGVREEKGAIYCDGSLSVTGGSFWAIGNTCTTPDASLTTANVIGLMFANSQPAGSLVNVTSGNNGIFTMTSPNNYKYVVYSGPELLLNAEYAVNYGGSTDGSGDHYVYFGGTYTPDKDGGTFTAGNPVTFYTIQ